MARSSLSIIRRTLLQGFGVGWLAQLLATPAKADCTPRASAAVGDTSDIWSNEYWAKKGEVTLYMFRKRLGAPKPGEPPRPVLFLVHGSSNSARTSFDMSVPGVGEYSMMNVFARYGFDVWTMDHEGYGRSSRTSGNSDIASGVEDLKAGVAVVMRETGVQKLHFSGASSGALRAAAYAMAQPERCDRLVLCAMTYKGTGAPTLTNRAEQIEYYRKNNTRPRGRIDIEKLFTRDKQGVADPRLAKARADRDLEFGDRVPSGTYLDMVANLPLVDPKKVLSPVLLVRGEFDGIATVEDLTDFYNQLPNGDRQMIILPGIAHSVQLAYNREQFWHVARTFLTMPPRIV